MGSEESVPHRNQERQSQVTQNEIDRILERQRLQYEERCWELLQANLPANTAPSTSQNTQRQSYPSPASVNAPGLRQQHPVTRTESPRSVSPRPVPPRPVPPRQVQPNISNPAPNRSSYLIETPTQNQNILERNRTPYSYSQNDLPTRGAHAPNARNNLYPNLNTSNAGGSNYNPNTNTRNGNSHENTDFLFVNNNGNIERPNPSAPTRDRSTSRPRPNSSDDNSAHCKTCNKIYGAYIYQCPNGHSSCKDCKDIARPCGLCGQHITDMRNITFEAYVSELSSPCPNKSEGCNIYIKIANMQTHIKECPFKVLDCPLAAIYGNCMWKGKINHMSKHFNDAHPENNQIGVDTEACLPNICTNNQVIHYTTLGNFNFLFSLKVSQADRKIYVVGQLLGTSVSAAKWNYALHIYNKREPRRKYQYSDICHTTWVPIDDIIKESKCGAIPLEHAMTFVNEGVITYKFFFTKEFDGTRNFRNKQAGRGGRRNN